LNWLNNMQTPERKKVIIDASGQSLGRLATQIAVILRGKNKVDFAPHKDDGDFVVIKNSQDIKITGNKLKNKVYHHFTGRVGGLKSETMEKFIEKRGIAQVIRKTVYGMLPTNKLRDRMIKRLTIC